MRTSNSESCSNCDRSARMPGNTRRRFTAAATGLSVIGRSCAVAIRANCGPMRWSALKNPTLPWSTQLSESITASSRVIA